jgi:hypothetical protein
LEDLVAIFDTLTDTLIFWPEHASREAGIAESIQVAAANRRDTDGVSDCL